MIVTKNALLHKTNFENIMPIINSANATIHVRESLPQIWNSIYDAISNDTIHVRLLWGLISNKIYTPSIIYTKPIVLVLYDDKSTNLSKTICKKNKESMIGTYFFLISIFVTNNINIKNLTIVIIEPMPKLDILMIEAKSNINAM